MSNCVICKQIIEDGQEIMTSSGPVHYGHCFTVFSEIPVMEAEDKNTIVESTGLLL